MKKILFIVGQTATGKTATALQLAEALNGELISADSRQVYIGMNVGTGKDIPNDFVAEDTTLLLRGKSLRAFTNGKTKIWLMDQVYPDEEWSVAQFSEAAWTIITNLWKQKKLPIIVGGTGFYVQSILNPAPSMTTPRQTELRTQLEQLTLTELQQRAQLASPERFQNLNNSDLQNPRRLIRIIEVAASPSKPTKLPAQKDIDALMIGLSADEELLEERIHSRVEQRVHGGMVQEVDGLLKKYGAKLLHLPAFSATGYNETADYLEKKSSLEELTANWTRRELEYAKRQQTWFKKQLSIQWFNIRDKQDKIRLDNTVKTWYHKPHGISAY